MGSGDIRHASSERICLPVKPLPSMWSAGRGLLQTSCSRQSWAIFSSFQRLSSERRTLNRLLSWLDHDVMLKVTGILTSSSSAEFIQMLMCKQDSHLACPPSGAVVQEQSGSVTRSAFSATLYGDLLQIANVTCWRLAKLIIRSETNSPVQPCIGAH
jgi:hypothetical protein